MHATAPCPVSAYLGGSYRSYWKRMELREAPVRHCLSTKRPQHRSAYRTAQKGCSTTQHRHPTRPHCSLQPIHTGENWGSDKTFSRINDEWLILQAVRSTASIVHLLQVFLVRAPSGVCVPNHIFEPLIALCSWAHNNLLPICTPPKISCN